MLFLRSDDANRAAFAAAGMGPFRYRRRGKLVALAYHQAPPEALEDATSSANGPISLCAAALRRLEARAKRPAAQKPAQESPRPKSPSKAQDAVTDSIDLQALARGEKPAWDGFVRRYAGLILSAVRPTARPGVELEDIVQEVFTRLCKDNFRLLKTYDPSRAGLSTWLTIVARSTARDMQRRRQPPITPIDLVPEVMLSVTRRAAGEAAPARRAAVAAAKARPDAALRARNGRRRDRDLARHRSANRPQHPSQGDAETARAFRG